MESTQESSQTPQMRAKKVYMTRQENEHLTELCLEHIQTISSRASDEKSRSDKYAAWQDITDRFNSQAKTKQEMPKLKKGWENIITRAKKRLTDINLNGQAGSAPNYLIRVTEALDEELYPLPNEFDNDNGHHARETNASCDDVEGEQTEQQVFTPARKRRVRKDCDPYLTMRESEHASYMEYLDLKKRKVQLEIQHLEHPRAISVQSVTVENDLFES